MQGLDEKDDSRKASVAVREGAALRFIREHPQSVHCCGDAQRGKALTSQVTLPSAWRKAVKDGSLGTMQELVRMSC